MKNVLLIVIDDFRPEIGKYIGTDNALYPGKLLLLPEWIWPSYKVAITNLATVSKSIMTLKYHQLKQRGINDFVRIFVVLYSS